MDIKDVNDFTCMICKYHTLFQGDRGDGQPGPRGPPGLPGPPGSSSCSDRPVSMQ